MPQQGHSILLTVLVVSLLSFSCQASSRANSKRLRWDDEPEQRSSPDDGGNKGERGLTFISNQAYHLSRKHQKMMWDLYLRKGYAPSLSNTADHHGDLPLTHARPSSVGTVTNEIDLLASSTKGHNKKGHVDHMDNNSLRRHPDVIASRILDQYEMTKASRIVPDYESEMKNLIVDNEQLSPSTPKPGRTGESSVNDRTEVESSSSETSLLSLLWNFLEENIGDLIGRETRDTIVAILWSWWTSFVEFAKSKGKRSIASSSLLLMSHL